MEITNVEKAREIAKKLSNPNIDDFGDGDDEFDTRFYHVCKDAALDAMDWKDKQHRQEKQQWIEKTCEWIKDNAAYFAHWEWNGDTYEQEVVFDAECCVEAFEESMKGE